MPHSALVVSAVVDGSKNDMVSTLLVTGGAGFIGSNFIHYWLRSNPGRIVNLDKLTYAGNPRNLAGLVAGSGRCAFQDGSGRGMRSTSRTIPSTMSST